jgi:hypothetical protein
MWNEYIIPNATQEEIFILDKQGFNWYPDSMDSNDIVIEGDEAYYQMALSAICRI